jgi:hypothetical protein
MPTRHWADFAEQALSGRYTPANPRYTPQQLVAIIGLKNTLALAESKFGDSITHHLILRLLVQEAMMRGDGAELSVWTVHKLTGTPVTRIMAHVRRLERLGLLILTGKDPHMLSVPPKLMRFIYEGGMLQVQADHFVKAVEAMLVAAPIDDPWPTRLTSMVMTAADTAIIRGLSRARC